MRDHPSLESEEEDGGNKGDGGQPELPETPMKDYSSLKERKQGARSIKMRKSHQR